MRRLAFQPEPGALSRALDLEQGAKAVDLAGEALDRRGVGAGPEDQRHPAARFDHPRQLTEGCVQVRPEVDDVDAEHLVEARRGERQRRDLRDRYVHAAGTDETAVPRQRDLGHHLRRIGADDRAARRLRRQGGEGATRPAADIEHLVVLAHMQGLDGPQVLGPGLARHDEGDQPAEPSARVARLLGDEAGPAHGQGARDAASTS